MDRSTSPLIPAGPGTLQKDVLEMLEVQASDSLPGWLAERLRSRCPLASIRLLRVFPGSAARIKDGQQEEFSVSDSDDEKGVRPLRDPLLLEAIRERACREERLDSGSRLVVILDAGGEVRYAIEVASRAPSQEPWLAEIAAIGRAYFERLAHLETDPLTRLRTRRVFQTHVEMSLGTWTTHRDRAYYLAVLDIDRFKRINDEFGHLYGDEILVHFANIMRRSFRASDLLYRLGGEEFLVIYGSDRGVPGHVAPERFRVAVENYLFPGVGKVTVSVGFTEIRDLAIPAAILFDRADQAVYYAKANGRNRVCGWELLVEAGHIKSQVASSTDVTLF